MTNPTKTMSAKQRRMRKLYWAQSGLCYLCGEIMIAPSVTRHYQNDPRVPSIDHVVPKCKFPKGYDHRRNMLLAHKKCNEQKCCGAPKPKHVKLADIVYQLVRRALANQMINVESTELEI